jgi:hypothetical protein
MSASRSIVRTKEYDNYACCKDSLHALIPSTIIAESAGRETADLRSRAPASAERQPIVHGSHESLRNFTVEREPGNVQRNELVYYDACGTPPFRQYGAFLPTNAAAALTGMP